MYLDMSPELCLNVVNTCAGVGGVHINRVLTSHVVIIHIQVQICSPKAYIYESLLNET